MGTTSPLRPVHAIFVALVCSTVLSAQTKTSWIEHPGNDAGGLSKLSKTDAFYQSSASRWFDVTFYRLHINVNTISNYVRGRVTIIGKCAGDTAGPLVLDLSNLMLFDSATVAGRKVAATHVGNSVVIPLDRRYLAGELATVDVFYEGSPQASGFGSFEFAAHQNVSWVYSLSEPSGARDWWPCKDDPSDKADSADIVVTCDSSFRVGSNGRLSSVVNNGDGTSTTTWQERYPISSYLISVAMTNFAQFSNWFKYSPTDSMQILNYVLPEHLSNALVTLPKTVDMLSVYSSLFGLYPFIQEKYGHSEFGSGGAMEHQTMTSTTTFDEDVISHELAHQWFGDMITCRAWSEIWLNEGFAQYCSALYREREYGTDSYWGYMNAQMNLAVDAVGAIGVPDTSSVRNLFDPSRIYNKGATVLHMLRHVLGDSVFFRSLRAYASDPAFRYSTATIRDFQTECQTVSGKDLNYFFQEWIYGSGYPEYGYSWSSKIAPAGFATTIEIDQSPRSGSPSFFTMPIDLRVSSGTWDTTVTVLNNFLTQQVTITTSQKPDRVVIDPDHWILKTSFSGLSLPPTSYQLLQNYPNPFNPKTTITFLLPYRSNVSLKVFDVLGREVSTLVDQQMFAGPHSVVWDASSTASGVYFYRLSTQPSSGSISGGFLQTRKMVVVK